MKPFPLCFVLVVGLAAHALALDVPLSYRLDGAEDPDIPRIAAVRVSDRDILAPGAKPAPVRVELGTTATITGGALFYDMGTTAGAVAGREFRQPLKGRDGGIMLALKQSAFAPETSATDLFLVVDYFDEPTTAMLLVARYQGADDSTTGSRTTYHMDDGPTFTATGQWKTHQFRMAKPEFAKSNEDWDELGIPDPGPVAHVRLSAEQIDPPFYSQGSAPLGAPQTTAPETVRKAPRTWAADPLYCMVTLGEQPRVMLFDMQSSASTLHDRVYFDSNANGDLTDDPVCDARLVIPMFSYVDFGPIETSVTVAGRAAPYSFVPNLQRATTARKTTATLARRHRAGIETNCHYEGTLEIGGMKLRVALCDRNVNGRFDDLFALDEPEPGATRQLAKGDELHLRGSGARARGQNVQLGGMLIAGKQVFDCAVMDAGRLMRLTPHAGPMGKLTIPDGVDGLSLYSSDGRRAIAAIEPGPELAVPPGRWGVFDYRLRRTDAAGAEWTISATSAPGAPVADVAAGGGATLAFGEPFTAKCTVPAAAAAAFRRAGPTRSALGNIGGFFLGGSGKSELPLRFSLVGSAGEEVTDLSLHDRATTAVEMARGGFRPREPRYKVVKADGELVTQGSFEYG